MKRVAIPLTVVVLMTALSAPPAFADDSALATSYAAAAAIAPGSGIVPTSSTNGDLADLLDFLTPVLDQVTTPIAATSTSLPTDAVSDLVTTFGADTASSADTSTSAPSGEAFPDCASDPWTADNCFNAVGSADAATVVALPADDAQGYAAADATGATARAQTTGATLSALGVTLGDIGTSTSTVTCAGSGSCTSAGSFSGVSLLDGTVAAKSADDGSLLVSVDGGDYVAPADLPDGTTVTDGDRTATVTATGSGVEVSVPMTLDELLAGLGVSDVLDSLNAYDDGSTINLDVILSGSNGADVNHGTGLTVGLGLDADVRISVLGLVGAEVSVPDTAGGNLATVQLAYTAATNAEGDTSGVGSPADLK